MARCGAGLLVAQFPGRPAWPAARWVGEVGDLVWPQRLIVPALANAVVLVGGYLAAAALAWGLADATMDQPRDLRAFDAPPPGGRRWRVAHLSDLHAVGERYGFRIESGRAGPRGNTRLERLLARLEAIHAERPVDLVLITGDMTDAGRSAEWAELLAALGRYPRLLERTLMLPGNHDTNVVDRANPGAARSADQSRRAPAPDADTLSRDGRARRQGPGHRSRYAASRRHALQCDGAAPPRHRGVRRCGGPAAADRAGAGMGGCVSDGAGARRRLRARRRPAQHVRRDAFLLHECARPHDRRAGAWDWPPPSGNFLARAGSWPCTTT